ncbi:unnamed protein product [Rangifer tarandus platyrhynchus]|uniref:Uncharacterized protein n=2 Tax=Rangifer tarandus platyrhynchus TaxID=3082113 RepID=A0ACB0EUK4_RANTA|nr:unnamed protein product [Rangifer tarandus platyrhynchus]CAI9704022.1 unnamed protein product [Rangifer tarandus platyrhynchus]
MSTRKPRASLMFRDTGRPSPLEQQDLIFIHKSFGGDMRPVRCCAPTGVSQTPFKVSGWDVELSPHTGLWRPRSSCGHWPLAQLSACGPGLR